MTTDRGDDSKDEPADGTLASWQQVVEMPDLLESATEAMRQEPKGAGVAAIARLRQRWSEECVRVALHLADARERARLKFSSPERLVCDRSAVEQASSECVAEWKAARFGGAGSRAGGLPIVDLCTGMGGDAMALARRGETLAIDRSALRAWMAGRNAGCATRVADVTTLTFPDALIHIDPARRVETDRRRSLTPIHTPSLAECEAITRTARGAALKLGPGTDPALIPADGGLEWISERRTLIQLVVWMGALREAVELGPAERLATRLPDGVTRRGVPVAVPIAHASDFERYLFVPDPALERSRLLGGLARDLGLAEPAAGLGLVTGNVAIASPWLEAYEIIGRPAADERRIADALRGLGADDVRVRTRGGSVDADAWTKALRRRLDRNERGSESPPSAGTLDVFLLRLGNERRALIAKACSQPG
ncbi:MAG: class I SAM-dependent methyltransferase [Phycisphaerae bacterium]|nr:class I SAM-dependent methyltransferase [Phycisphaerae bacterium]